LTGGAGAVGNNLGAGSATVGSGESDQLTRFVVTDGVQGAMAAVNHDARATTQWDLAVRAGDRHEISGTESRREDGGKQAREDTHSDKILQSTAGRRGDQLFPQLSADSISISASATSRPSAGSVVRLSCSSFRASDLFPAATSERS
jgi:hypothetical protein